MTPSSTITATLSKISIAEKRLDDIKNVIAKVICFIFTNNQIRSF